MIYSVVGYYALILGLISGSILVYFSVQNFRNSEILDTKILSLSFLQLLFVVVSFFGLVLSFVVSDFSNETVFNNSHTTKPLFYKITGTWGNHEGSLLLWLLVLTLFIFIFLLRTNNQTIKYKTLTTIFQQIIIIGFFIFLLKTSNPFNYLFPIPEEGLGLNPILQDPALAIHPPILYLGYVGSSIIFSSALAATTLKMVSGSWATHIKKWTLVSWIFLTLGILLGSIWAYYELGWGGFWFWDPVENASLLPWFAMTALLHSLLVLEKREALYFWTIILCLITFTLSVTGTFLVRSGILNSVHTFANDPSRGIYILTFLGLMIFASVYLLFTKYKPETNYISANSKETFVLINNWFMMFYLLTVLLGTLYPIFTDVIFNSKISVGPPFYNSVIIPVVVFFLFLMAIGPQAKWIKNKFVNLKPIIIILLGAILINFAITYLFKSYSIISNLIIISSLFLIISSFLDFFKKTKLNFARIVSHLSFGFLIFFIGLNHNFSIEKDFNLKLGETKKIGNFEFILKDLELRQQGNYKAVVGNLKVSNLITNQERNLKPEIRIYDNPKTLTYEASIQSNFFRDYYLTMSNIDRSDYYNIKFQEKPLMIWIWISVVMLSIGGFLSFFKNAKNN